MNGESSNLALLAACLLLALASCDDGSSGGGGGGGSGSSSQAQALLTAACARQTECCPGKESQEACEDGLRLAVDGLFGLAHVQAVQANVDACVAALDAVPCPTAAAYGGLPPILIVCEPFTVGDQPAGAPCGGESLAESIFGDQQCESGQCVGGACVPLGGEGAACSVSCQGELLCFHGACVAGLDAGVSCDGSSPCLEGLECFGDGAGGPSSCSVPETISIGEPCGAGKVCELGADTCRCPPDDLGCATGLCGDVARCLP